MLTIYGSSACSACKTFLQMAKAQGHDPRYLLLDQDDRAQEAFQFLDVSSRELPVVVHETPMVRVVTSGLANAMKLLNSLKV